MSDAKFVNIAKLMTSYNFEIEELPNNLKCAKCKLVLKDACQVPCGCRFCRACINDMMVRGGEICPGDLEDCGESLLSHYQSDYASNKTIMKLAVKCPNNGCMIKCRLGKIEEHLRECLFCEFGCTQHKLVGEGIGGNFQQEIHKHSQLLIGMIANINREIETLKERDEVSSREIEMLKERNEASSREIEMLKLELILKDGQIRSIMDQMINVQNESKSIKNDIKSIKEENADLAGQVRILSGEIEREVIERHENDELDSARVIDHVDRGIAAVTGLIGSNKDELYIETQSVKSNVESIKQDTQSIKDDICWVKSQVQSIQTLMGLGEFDASCVWLIDNVDNTFWRFRDRQSEYFSGLVYPYKYRLASWNSVCSADATLYIQLRIHTSQNDGQLAWPFEARVVITVSDRDRGENYRSISLQCQIERPPDNEFRRSDTFVFLHSDLVKAGLNLSRGVRVSCVIVPGFGR